jgi:WD40 repeat protein
MRTAHLFFSYARLDAARLYPIHARLQARLGHTLWIDKVELRQGVEWENAIKMAIQQSYGILFALTKTFVQPERDFIHGIEIPLAIERFRKRQGTSLFVLRFDDVPVPSQLEIPHVTDVIDAFDYDETTLADVLKPRLPAPKPGDHRFFMSWPRLDTFVGREQQLMTLHDHLKASAVGIKTAGLHGMGGIGKTQLAVEYAHRYRFHYPAGVYWLNAVEDWAGRIANISDNLGLSPADPHDRDRNKQMVFALLNFLRGQTTPTGDEALIILDNLEHPEDVDSHKLAGDTTLRQFCEQSNARLLVTSRSQDFPAHFESVAVDVLSPIDAHSLLLDARPNTDDHDSLDLLARKLGYLPLALAWMAAALKSLPHLTPADLLQELEARGIDDVIHALQEEGVGIGTPDYYTPIVGVALDWQLGQLNHSDALLLLRLAAAYGEAAAIPNRRLKLLSGIQEHKARFNRPFTRALEKLHTWSLVERLDDGEAVRLHPLTRDHLQRAYDVADDLAQAAHRLLRACHDPATLHEETQARGFAAVLGDLSETRSALTSHFTPERHLEVPDGELPPLAALARLERLFGQEAHKLRRLPASRSTSFVIQQIRERALQQEDHELRAAYDRWLATQPHMRTLAVWRLRADRALKLVLDGHQRAVNAAAISPDGRYALSGSVDCTLRLWDLASGRDMRHFTGQVGEVYAVAFSADGRYALSGGDDGCLRLWDVASGTQVRNVQAHPLPVHAVVFSPDTQFMLSGSEDGMIYLWHRHSGECVRTFEGHQAYVTALAFSSSGDIAVSGSWDQTVRIWDVKTGSLLNTLYGHQDTVTSVALNPIGTTAASGSWDGTVHIWDVWSGQLANVIEPSQGEVYTLAFTPDGNFVIVGGQSNHASMYDIETDDEVRVYTGHQGAITAVALNAREHTLLTASKDRTLRVWDMTAGSEDVRAKSHTAPISSVAFSDDDYAVQSTALDGSVRLWEVRTAQEKRVFSDNSAALLAGKLLMQQSQILTIGIDRVLRTWNLKTGKQLSPYQLPLRHGITAAAFDRDGAWLAAGCEDSTLRILKVAARRELLAITTPYVTAVALAADGRFALSAASDNNLYQWSLPQKQPSRVLSGHRAGITHITIHRNSDYALSSSEDGTVRVWDLFDGKALFVLEGHEDATRAAAFSPDGRLIATVSDDRTLRLWESETGRCLLVYAADAALHCCAWSNDRRLIAVGDSVGRVLMLECAGF